MLRQQGASQDAEVPLEGRRECDIPLAPPGDAEKVSCITYTRTGRFRMRKSRIPKLGTFEIRLSCGHLKVFVPPPTNPFEPPAVAKGITH